MSSAYCPHGEDVNVECRPCERAADQGHAPAPPPVRRTVIEAGLVSYCAACDAIILPGDLIALDEEDGWVHHDPECPA